MMKLSLCVLLICCSFCSLAETLDSLMLEGNTLFYHSVESQSAEKKGLVIYMHGGVSQFKGLSKSMVLSTEALLEGNADFLSTMNQNGFDVLLPIAFNAYNWLEEKGEHFVKVLMDQYGGNRPVYIAGFSDGGTGAYRMFYSNSELFEGLLVFNGFPQLDNFQKEVDYSAVTSKTVIFAGTLKDSRVPVEFLMVEHRRQQMLNKNTFLLLRSGKHAFGAYEKQDFERCIDLMAIENKKKPDSRLICVYPPLDALVVQGEVRVFYSFRKSKGKAYGMVEQEYVRTDYSFKEFSKMLESADKVQIEPLYIEQSELEALSHLVYTIVVDGINREVKLKNWLNCSAW